MLSPDVAQRYFELSNDLICSFTLDGYIEEPNPRWLDVLGYSAAELRERHWISFVHPDDVERTKAEAWLAAQGRQPVVEFENRVMTRAGDVRHLLWSAILVPERARVFGVGRDVTDRRRREDELERARLLLAEAERVARLGSWDWNVGSPIATWSPELRAMLGVGPDEEVDLDLWRSLVHPDDYEGWLRTYREGVARGRPFDLRFRVHTRGGREIVVHERAEIELDEAGEVTRLHGTIQDVSDEADVTRRLRRMTQAAVEINAAPTIEAALDATTLAARDVIGAHQVVTSLTAGRSMAQRISSFWLSDKYADWRDYDVPPDGSGIVRIVTEHQTSVCMTQEELEAHPSWRGFGPQAEQHPPMRGWLAAPLISKHGETLGLVQLTDRVAGEFTADDEQLLVQLAHITSTALDRLDLEERFLQAQRVEAVGRLAAGIIHDFNNTLAVMLVRSELLQASVSDPAVVEHAAELQGAARAAADVARDLLALSRTDSAEAGGREELPPAEPTDTRCVIRDVVRLAAPMLGEGVAIELDLPDEPLPTLLGKTDLHQVLMNLVLNARDAVGGTGTIHVHASTLDEHILLRVRDDGIGMDAETRARIFTPYFTTKASSGGTGLGLAGVQTIVARAGGRIDVQSTPGAGATFSLHIPHAGRSTALVPAAASRALPGGDEPVAVVGRNRSVVAVIEALLDSLGYAVAPSRPGREPDLHGAALIVVEDPDPGALVRSELPPDAAVLYVAGPHGTCPVDVPDCNLLHRPVSADALARRVRLILDRRRSPTRELAGRGG